MPYRFLTFELDEERRELLAAGAAAAISPRAFDVLAYLIRHRDRMATKAELMDRFWSRNVSEAALQKAVSQARKALGPAGAGAIRTYHGRGFRFVAPVAETEAAQPAPARSPFAPAEMRYAAVLRLRLGDAPESFLAEAKAIVERHEGALLRMMNDGFTAAFGLDPLREDGARRAAHSAAALAALGAGACFGLDSGAIGAPDDGGWTLPEEVEQGAVALADRARPGETLLSGAAREQLRDEAETAPAPGGFRLLALAEMSAGIPARPRRRPTRFVGRSAEMTFLAAQSDNLLRGEGQAVTLSGPPGIGKTRLATEFLAALDHIALRPLKTQCLPALANTPLAPIRALCIALPERARRGAADDDIDLALLDEILHETNAPALHGLSDPQRRRRGFALIDRMLAIAAEEKPLVIVFEDVHWLDATSRDYLAHLLRDIGRRRLMAVLTTRPAAGAALTEAALNLSSLGRAECLALLSDASGEADLPAAAAEALIGRASGNPFFIEELALAAQSGGDPATDLPATVQAVIAARIGALDPALRAAIHVIAAIGPPAPPALIAHLLQETEAEIEAKAARLVQAGFLDADLSGCALRHMLINDAAHAMIEPTDRRCLHGEIAAWLEREGAEAARPERLAWHHQEAGATARAISCWAAASRAALQRSAHREAAAFAENGLALAEDAAPGDLRRKLDLLLLLGPALRALRGFAAEEVGAAYRQAEALNETLGDARSEIRIQVGLWIYTWVRGRLTESLGHADQLLSIATRTADPALTLQAHASRGQVLTHMGDLRGALAHLEKGLAAAAETPPESIPAQSAAVSCAAYAAWVAGLMGRDRAAAGFLGRARDLAGLRKNPFAEAILHALGAAPFMFGDDPETCLASAERAVALSREHDFAFWLGTGLVMRGWALARRGDFTPAFESLDEGIAVFEATGAGVQLANWRGLQAEALLRADRPEAALAAAGHALSCAERAEDMFFTPRIHAVAALAQERLGRAEDVAAHLREASALARRFGIDARFLSIAGAG
ncbi:MAG: ATP-binding protein [Pikeienuella sp.]